MSRHIAYIDSHAVRIETERKITHLLTGQLDEASVRPDELIEREARLKMSLGKDGPPLNLDELKTLSDWIRMKSHGAFERKPLDWCESVDQAEMAKEHWPQYINFAILTVDVHIV